jgi:hypothetical protein
MKRPFPRRASCTNVKPFLKFLEKGSSIARKNRVNRVNNNDMLPLEKMFSYDAGNTPCNFVGGINY